MINTSNKSKLNEIHLTNERYRRVYMHHSGSACWRDFLILGRKENGGKKKQRENEFWGFLVGRIFRKENWWDPSVFSSGPIAFNLPKLGKKIEWKTKSIALFMFQTKLPLTPHHSHNHIQCCLNFWFYFFFHFWSFALLY